MRPWVREVCRRAALSAGVREENSWATLWQEKTCQLQSRSAQHGYVNVLLTAPTWCARAGETWTARDRRHRAWRLGGQSTGHCRREDRRSSWAMTAPFSPAWYSDGGSGNRYRQVGVRHKGREQGCAREQSVRGIEPLARDNAMLAGNQWRERCSEGIMALKQKTVCIPNTGRRAGQMRCGMWNRERERSCLGGGWCSSQ